MKALGLALALLVAAVATAAPALEPFRVPALGFSIEPPESWQRVSEDEMFANLRGIDVVDRDAVNHAMESARSASLVTLTKYPIDHAGVNPTIKVAAFPRDRAAGLTAIQMMTYVIEAFRANFTDAEIAEGPVLSRRFGIEGAYARISFTLRTGGDALPTRSEMWLVPSGDRIFVISAAMAVDEPPSTRAEIETILDSVRISGPTV